MKYYDDVKIFTSNKDLTKYNNVIINVTNTGLEEEFGNILYNEKGESLLSEISIERVNALLLFNNKIKICKAGHI